MKKNILLLITVVLLTGCSKIENETVTDDTTGAIKTFDSDIVCTFMYDEIIEDDEIKSTSNIYIYYDDDNYVTKAIYQSISDSAYYNNNLLLSMIEIIDLYNEIDGVSARYYTVGDKLVMEFMYNYETIDLSILKETIGSLLSEDSLFYKVKSIPVSLDKFKSIELVGYDCQ